MNIYNTKKGQDISEWAIAVALIAVMSMSVLFMFAPQMNAMLKFINDSIFTVSNKQ
ncbi:MAG: hypothetical protein PHC34_00615 [Candidatus Gastranaerophilales bacterium]|nr:hypothetical protein [Candidatus Gastranaerophilales bacterium]